MRRYSLPACSLLKHSHDQLNAYSTTGNHNQSLFQTEISNALCHPELDVRDIPAWNRQFMVAEDFHRPRLRRWCTETQKSSATQFLYSLTDRIVLTVQKVAHISRFGSNRLPKCININVNTFKTIFWILDICMLLLMRKINLLSGCWQTVYILYTCLD